MALDETYLLLRISILIVVLSYASYHDIRRRMVPDHVWYLAALIGGLALTYGYFVEPSFFVIHIPQMVLVVGIGVALLFLPVFGKPDALAIIYLGVLLPELVVFRIGQGPIFAPFAIVALLYGLLLSLSVALDNFLNNIRWKFRVGPLFADVSAPMLKKILILFVAKKVTLTSLEKDRFAMPIQSGSRLSKIREMLSIQKVDLLYRSHSKNEVELKTDPISNSILSETSGIWVQRLLPFFPYLLMGLIVVILGDTLGILSILKIG